MQRKRSLLILLVLASLLLAPALAQAQEGTVSISFTGVAAGVGVSWGSGVLTYGGKTYPFKIDGLSVGDVGISTMSASGTVKNLKNVADFAGNYAAVGTGLAVGGGASVLTMQNQRGVVMDITATQAGVKFNFGPQGMTVTLK
jgi:hypothetical protein